MPAAASLMSALPWVLWLAGSLLLLVEPLSGSALFGIGAIWSAVSLCLARYRAAALRLALLVVLPLPAIAILWRRTPILEDVGLIFAPYYLAPAIASALAALVAAVIILFQARAR